MSHSSTHSSESSKYQLNGWIVSPYTQKVAAYMRYKGLNFDEQVPNGYQLMVSIPKKVGKAIMPTLTSPEGEWLQDSTEIIDALEREHSQRSIQPQGPRQQIAAHLLELHGDEWLVMPALHYRWTMPESRRFIINEFGQYALPFMPKFIRYLAGNHIRKMMMSYMPRFGIVGDTEQGVRAHTETLITLLETHFSQHEFFLGSRPCVGDFAFYGQLYAHLYRDPGSRYLFEQAPNVVAWMERLQQTSTAQTPEGEFLADDQVPATLEPILQLIFSEQIPFCISVSERINQYLQNKPDAKRVSRIVGEGDFSIGGISGKRNQFSFVQWKLQRAHQPFAQLNKEEKADIGDWLNSLGGENFTQLEIKHPLKREQYREVLA